LHDHLTGRQRYSVGSTDAEVIATCIDHKIDLPDNMLAPQVTLQSLTRTLEGLCTLVDLAVVEQALKKAHSAFFEKNIQPLFDQCKSRKEAQEVVNKVTKTLESKVDGSIEMPASIEFFLRKERDKFSRKTENDEIIPSRRTTDADGGPSI
jgi:hypothetical protein